MKKKSFLLLLLAAVVVSSCSTGSTTTYVPSSDPTVAAMRFSARDSMPGLSAAVFVVENKLDGDTGIIYAKDSLQYGTRLDTVVPVFTYSGARVAGSYLFSTSDTVALVGGDTINFTTQPLLLHVISEDLTAEKWYNIYAPVHKVDPDLFSWCQRSKDFFSVTANTRVKIVNIADVFYLYTSDGAVLKAYSSADFDKWSEQTVTGLPTDIKVANIMATEDILYYASSAALYISTDGLNWHDIYTPTDFEFINLLFAFNDSLWAIVKDDATLELRQAVSADGSSWEMRNDSLSDDFPVSDFATLSFRSAANRRRAMVVGGLSAKGEKLNCRWNVDWDRHRYRWVDFSKTDNTFPYISGVSIIEYNNSLLMFGGSATDNSFGDYGLLESADEGMNWNIPDSVHNCMPTEYGQRTQVAVKVKDNTIYIVGGKSKDGLVLTDSYSGKLNSIDW